MIISSSSVAGPILAGGWGLDTTPKDLGQLRFLQDAISDPRCAIAEPRPAPTWSPRGDPRNTLAAQIEPEHTGRNSRMLAGARSFVSVVT